MTLGEVINYLIEDGIASLAADYPHIDHTHRRTGGQAGFEACRGCEPDEIRELLAKAAERRLAAEAARAADVWYHKYYESQVRYVAEVLSVGLELQRLPALVTITPQARLRYGEIVGVERITTTKGNGSRQ